MKRLSVNVDHIANIRQARLTNEPDPVAGGIIAELSGAVGITVHLREDRRHIQDRDLEIMRKICRGELNLEMAATDEMVNIAKKILPDWVCLVPEKRKELTTEGGLDLLDEDTFRNIKRVTNELRNSGIKVSLFLDPDEKIIKKALETGCNAIEIHTGEYANAKTHSEKELELEKIKKSARLAKSLGFEVHAGHGLTYMNIGPIAEIDEISEVSIGHSIIANAVLFGLEKAVREMIKLLNP